MSDVEGVRTPQGDPVGGGEGMTGPGVAVQPTAPENIPTVDVDADGNRTAVEKPDPTINKQGGVGDKPYGPQRPIHSRYADGTPVYDGEQPPRTAPVKLPPAPGSGVRTYTRYDTVNDRPYQEREYEESGRRVRDIDHTNPTYPNGRERPGHYGPPHQHVYDPVTNGHGPAEPYDPDFYEKYN